MRECECVEAPDYYVGVKPSIFLAGGITNCADWQDTAVRRLLLEGQQITIFNPRRQSWGCTMPADSMEEQIRWEHTHLRRATAILFWFSHETVQPITLLEYGLHLHDTRRLFVGVDPRYERRFDVELQTALYRGEQHVHNSLDTVLDEALAYFNGERA